jgi:hypothetical protein
MSCVSSTEGPSFDIVTSDHSMTSLKKYIPLNHPISGSTARDLARYAGHCDAGGLLFVARNFALLQLMGFSFFSMDPIRRNGVQKRWHQERIRTGVPCTSRPDATRLPCSLSNVVSRVPGSRSAYLLLASGEGEPYPRPNFLLLAAITMTQAHLSPNHFPFCGSLIGNRSLYYTP